MSTSRIWFARLGTALIAVLALGTPLLLGLFGYLALNDGIDWNTGDPLREGRLFMVREKRRMTGIAIVTKSAETAKTPAQSCARTQYNALLWSPALGLDRNSAACSCYAMQDGRLREVSRVCD
jgi:hypothetical protein